jgi:separase
MSDAAKYLAVSLRGSTSELEELLVESTKLKKAVMVLLNTSGDILSAERDATSDIGDLGCCIIRYLKSFVRFLNRYLGQSLSQERNLKDNPLFQQRLQKCGNILHAAVDSIIAIGKISVVAQQPSWDDIQPLLGECATLLRYLHQKPTAEFDSTLSASRTTGFVKLSNLYWSQYLRQKDLGKSSTELVSILERSTSLLEMSSPSEKRSGFAGIKCERLAALYNDIGQIEKSEMACFSSIQAHLEAGALDSAATDASKKSLSCVWKNTKSSAFVLGRVLALYVRIRWKHRFGADDIVFDDKSLVPEQRGLLLEWQAAVLMDVFATVSPDGASSLSLTSTISTLLSIYQVNEYPIRRCRVILRAIRFSLKNPNLLDPGILATLKNEATQALDGCAELSNDCSLSAFAEYISTSLRLALGFSHGHLQVDDLLRVVNSWVLIMQSCEKWESVEKKVDDPLTWISEMMGIVDYLDMLGLWKLKLAALGLLQRILELQESKDYSAIVSCISKMGLQFSRLGCSERAESLFSHAAVYIDRNNVSYAVSLAWHLAYAESLVEIGNIEKW